MVKALLITELLQRFHSRLSRLLRVVRLPQNIPRHGKPGDKCDAHASNNSVAATFAAVSINFLGVTRIKKGFALNESFGTAHAEGAVSNLVTAVVCQTSVRVFRR